MCRKFHLFLTFYLSFFTINLSATETKIDLALMSGSISVERNFTADQPSLPSERLPVKLTAKVYNFGVETAENVQVRFIAISSSGHRFLIARETAEKIEGGTEKIVSTIWQPKIDAGEVFVHVDPSNKIFESNETNNTIAHRQIFNSFQVSPEKGSNGEMSSWSGKLHATLLPETVRSSTFFAVEELPQNLELVNLPELNYVTNTKIYKLSFIGENFQEIATNNFSIGLNFTLPELNNVDQFALTTVLRYDEVDQFWTKEGIEIVDLSETQMVLNSEKLGIFALFTSRDETLPSISITVDDLQLRYDGQFSSGNPRLIIFAEDAGGVSELELSLDGIHIPRTALTMFDRSMNGRTILAEYEASSLNDGIHLFEVTVADLSGNVARKKIDLEVGGNLQLKGVANRPNPFESETWFTYFLTKPVHQVALKIYSVSGQQLHELIELPKNVGYNEILWNGNDKNNQAFASGVYFYRISVVGDDGSSITQTSKLAIIRD